MVNGQSEDLSLEAGPESWVGLSIGDYTIQKQLGEGAFSTVYLGESTTNGSSTVFKVAKKPGQIGKLSSSTATMFFPTQALFQMTGSFGHAEPDGAALLLEQAEKLQSVLHSGLVQIHEVVSKESMTYYECEYLEGKTLREMFLEKSDTLPTLIRLAQVLDALSKNEAFGYHGDVKPDNIIVTKSGIKLIDPGYFGKIMDRGQELDHVAVTTPAYYPTLTPDDLFAFGVIAWEALVGEHPLPTGMSSDQLTEDRKVSPELLQFIQMREVTGNYYSSGLLLLEHPSNIRSDITPALGNLLLKLLRLRVERDTLVPDQGFRSFAAASGALIKFM